MDGEHSACADDDDYGAVVMWCVSIDLSCLPDYYIYYYYRNDASEGRGENTRCAYAVSFIP